jgi:hypothetical protein
MSSLNFDSATGYLKNPPPIYELDFSTFDSQYGNWEKKKFVLQLLKDYCINLNKNAIRPKYIIIGGEYVRNSESINKLKVILVFAARDEITPVIHEYIQKKGKYVAKYNQIIEPKGFIKLSIGADYSKKLAEDDMVKALQYEHLLDNKLQTVGVICLQFDGITT